VIGVKPRRTYSDPEYDDTYSLVSMKQAAVVVVVGGLVGHACVGLLIGARMHTVHIKSNWSPAMAALQKDHDIAAITNRLAQCRRECNGMPIHVWADFQMPCEDELAEKYGKDFYCADTWLTPIQEHQEHQEQQEEDKSVAVSKYRVSSFDRRLLQLPFTWFQPYASLGALATFPYLPPLTYEQEEVIEMVRKSARLQTFVKMHPHPPLLADMYSKK
jgi:hypothetical protein